MMRDAFRARIRAAGEAFIEQLVGMLEENVNQQLNQLELAFEAATSAFASDLSVTDGAARRHDVRGKGRVDRAAAQPRSRRVEDSGHSPRSAQVDTESDSGAAASTSADTKPLPDRAQQQGQDLPPSTSRTTAGKQRQRAVMRCKSCGEVGKRSDSCGITHNVSTSSASGPPPAITSSPTTSSISRSPARAPRSVQAPGRAAQAVGATAGDLTSQRTSRFADIEAAKKRREDAQREREARAKSFIRKPTPKAPSSTDAIEQADADLPSSVSTFEL
jgi:hypothetical protein